MEKTAGTLYLVSTPIGNLEDITFRAINTLKNVSIVLAEDTTKKRILFSRYEIKTPLHSYYEHIEKRMTPRILEKLLRGNDIALVVESGTPSISDPGFYLVREAKKIAIPVVAIPGATALIAALVSTGFPTDKFVFDGFLSSGANTRRRQIEALKGMTRTIILYESPRRVKSTLELVFEILGDIRGAICREMTKIHEEIVIDSVSGLLRWVDTKKPLKGEITLLLNQKDFILESKTPLITEEKVTKMIQHALFKGMSMRKLSIEISERTGLSKKKIYELALQIKNELY